MERLAVSAIITDPARLLGKGWCAAYRDGCHFRTQPCPDCGQDECPRHGHTWGLHRRYCERDRPQLEWIGDGPRPGSVELRVWGCHDGDDLHVYVTGIEEDWGEGGEWFARYDRVVYAATGVELDEDLEAAYSDAFEYAAHDYFSD